MNLKKAITARSRIVQRFLATRLPDRERKLPVEMHLFNRDRCGAIAAMNSSRQTTGFLTGDFFFPDRLEIYLY